jgi:hypothetical protein
MVLRGVGLFGWLALSLVFSMGCDFDPAVVADEPKRCCSGQFDCDQPNTVRCGPCSVDADCGQGLVCGPAPDAGGSDGGATRQCRPK